MAKQTDVHFEQLIAQYERLVYTVCRRLVQDASVAEDLTQETFLSAYLHLDSCPMGYEKPWLARIAVNKAKDYLQSAWNRHTVLPGDEGMPPGRLSPSPEVVALTASGTREIEELIHQLREPYRSVCELHLLQERSPEETALALGRPVKTVHTQIARAKAILREQIERSESRGIV